MRLSKIGSRKFKEITQQMAGLEPMGIVIADGGRGDKQPRLSAFVWGPVPDDIASTSGIPSTSSTAFGD